MGDVVNFPDPAAFVIQPPRRPLSPVERIKAAHLVLGAVEPHLTMPTDATSGLTLLARTAVVQLAHGLGAEAAARFAETIAHDLRDAAKLGWCGGRDDEPPRPAA